MGALARLDAVTGEPERALEAQKNLAELWQQLGEDRRSSYPLCEWLRLAGALKDWESFAHAERFKRKVEGSFEKNDRCYVNLAWARAEVLFKSDPSDDAPKTLEPLANDDNIPSLIKWSARRALKTVESEEGAPSEYLAIQRNSYLVSLDKAVKDNQPVDAKRAVQRLRKLEPGLITHLLDAAHATDQESSIYVQRFYPY